MLDITISQMVFLRHTPTRKPIIMKKDVSYSQGQVMVSLNQQNDCISIESDKWDSHLIELFAINGKLIAKGRMIGKYYQLDTSALLGGVYFVRVISGKQETTHRIIIRD
jgi:hypothetical protein